MNETSAQIIIRIALLHYPAVQGIYLFGSHETAYERAESDVDIALLLPAAQAKRERDLAMSRCRADLEDVLHKRIDLLNLRRVATVLQKEIIAEGRLIHCADRYAVEEFEMLVLSFYQKLNEERAEVLAEGLRSGRFYAV